MNHTSYIYKLNYTLNILFQKMDDRVVFSGITALKFLGLGEVKCHHFTEFTLGSCGETTIHLQSHYLFKKIFTVFIILELGTPFFSFFFFFFFFFLFFSFFFFFFGGGGGGVLSLLKSTVPIEVTKIFCGPSAPTDPTLAFL